MGDGWPRGRGNRRVPTDSVTRCPGNGELPKALVICGADRWKECDSTGDAKQSFEDRRSHGFQGVKYWSVASIDRTSPSRYRSLSRQGHPKIAHRFNGGISQVFTAKAPSGATELAALAKQASSRLDPAARASVVPAGTQTVVQHLRPTVETVGYFRESLRDNIQEFPLRKPP